jgi:hypothetical protein
LRPPSEATHSRVDDYLSVFGDQGTAQERHHRTPLHAKSIEGCPSCLGNDVLVAQCVLLLHIHEYDVGV